MIQRRGMDWLLKELTKEDSEECLKRIREEHGLLIHFSGINSRRNTR
jgi:hypothetical protein